MPADRASGDFGGRLREARERRGISLRQIANATKIAVGVLEALERNDISRLPGGIFGRAFVRSYAVEVGLDPEETIRQFIAQFPTDSVTVGHPASSQVEDSEGLESDRRTASTFLRLIIVSLPIAAAVVYLTASGRLSSRSASPERPPAPAAAPPSGVPATVPDPAPAPTPAPPAPIKADRLAVSLTASRQCWLAITADGQKRERMLQPGERETFDVRRELVMTAGDAAAITMTINGVRAKPLGKDGVPATVRLNPTNYKSYLEGR